MGLIIAIGVYFLGFLIFGKKENPYIKLHKRKWRNETDYKEYLQWLSKHGGDVPLSKSRIKEDIEFENEIRKHI